ncbi:uncharacterized protein N7482_003970 [Penicillium canariense]|uniref:Uncharacterized protein n=1 Tax=Penicillium canariense TaxID=189055 RepID=A0A9W9I7I0_9EURO|nr:uncharacterized protein N7482_003970 [Penicillium canariense]KAJ5168376.1 hypothetical protein N7482_003970 [Penicillium canariense]
MSCLSSPPGDPRAITTRPKLTLQTSSLPRTFGSSTTSLSLSFAASSTASPTVRNTFKNAYDVTSPASATSPPSKAPSHRFNSSKPISPYVYHPNNNPNTFSYRTPTNFRSGGPGSAGARRVFFPAKKQVSYRNPLEEEIRTEHYTAQHLDLIQEEEADEAVRDEADPADAPPADLAEDDSDSASQLSLSEMSSASSDEVSLDERATRTPLSKTERKKRRTMRTERQVRAVALLDGFESDPDASSTPQTPRQGRVKRRREWKWTLGPAGATADDVHPETSVRIPPSELDDPPPDPPFHP